MSERTEQKIAFITGGNRGLGFQTALDLGPLDIHVVIGSRDGEKGEEAVNKLRLAGVIADSLVFDIEKPEDHISAFNHFQAKYGRLDILLNNAGYMSGSGPNATTTQTPIDSLRKHFDINFFQQFALTQTLLPLLLAAPAARIVNLSSILGSLTLHSTPGSPIYDSKVFAYDASKTALNAFTVHLAYDLKDTKIKVNSAHPGWVKTEMGGPNAMMEVSEGGKTSAELATLPEDGPTGGFFHVGQTLPW